MSYTVLSAEFFTENNTFKKGFTELRDFRADTLALGSAAIDLRGSAQNTELAGFLSAAKELGWTLKHTVSATAAPAGPVSREAFEYIAGIICDAALVLGGELDGILLGLHGAQVVEFCEDGEGELLRRLRMIVGPDLPIAVTLDLHANATQAMVELAQIWVSYKTYPHVDIRFAGHRAAHLLHAAMAGQTRPATLRRAPPMLEEATSGRSDTGPMVAAYARARAEEKEPGILTVSLNAGFAEAGAVAAGGGVGVGKDAVVDDVELFQAGEDVVDIGGEECAGGELFLEFADGEGAAAEEAGGVVPESVIVQFFWIQFLWNTRSHALIVATLGGSGNSNGCSPRGRSTHCDVH
jgi:microcystin degradation protein MlrC